MMRAAVESMKVNINKMGSGAPAGTDAELDGRDVAGAVEAEAVEEAAGAAVEDPTEGHVEEPAEGPVEEPAEDPAEGPVEAPAKRPAAERPKKRQAPPSGKKRKKKKAKAAKDPDRKRPVLPWVVLGCLIAALAVYGVAIHIQTEILSAYDKAVVYTATSPMAAGDVMDADEAAGKVAPIEIPATAAPADAVTDPAVLADSAARYGIEPGTILCASMFETVDSVLEGMNEPVIAGFRSEDIYQVVGGVLRAGDTISIYTVDNVAEIGAAEYEGTLRWDSIRVQDVFDSSGLRIGSDDATTPASRVNIYMEKGDVEEFYASLAQGSLRVVVHCR